MLRVMSDTENFLFAKWPVEVHRRAFRRSVGIYLKPQKPIKVVAGKTTSTKVIIDFLLVKKDWIEKSFQKFDELSLQFPTKKIIALESFPFMGANRTLKVVITLQKKSFVSLTDDSLLLHIPRNEWSADSIWQEHPLALEHIRHFYKREAKKEILKRVDFWSEKMNLKPSLVKFREQRTRWGSCTSKGVINLNWRLIVFAPEVIDYVIVHELAHLAHMDHSNRFWFLVETHHANFKECMKILKDQYRTGDFLNTADR